MTEALATTEQPQLDEAETARRAEVEQDVIKGLRTVFDPEIPVNVYELGLIYDIQLTPAAEDKERYDARIIMTLTTPGCPVAGTMPGMVQRAVLDVPQLSTVEVDLVWDPPWDRTRMSEEAKLLLNMY